MGRHHAARRLRSSPRARAPDCGRGASCRSRQACPQRRPPDRAAARITAGALLGRILSGSPQPRPLSITAIAAKRPDRAAAAIRPLASQWGERGAKLRFRSNQNHSSGRLVCALLDPSRNCPLGSPTAPFPAPARPTSPQPAPADGLATAGQAPHGPVPLAPVSVGHARWPRLAIAAPWRAGRAADR